MAASESQALRSQANVSIEAMTEHDLLEVCQIEEMSDLSAWGWDAYHRELESAQDTIMLVARTNSMISNLRSEISEFKSQNSNRRSQISDLKFEISEGFELAGFIVARIISGELHVNNVAVRPEFRRYRIGSSLVEKTLEVAQHHGATVAHLEVRAGNEAAQRLYVRCGFRVTGRRRNYYRTPVEDALLMSRSFVS